jgi:hypothetical protein
MGQSNFVHKKVPRALTAMTSSQTAMDNVSLEASFCMPALLQSTSNGYIER